MLMHATRAYMEMMEFTGRDPVHGLMRLLLEPVSRVRVQQCEPLQVEWHMCCDNLELELELPNLAQSIYIREPWRRKLLSATN